MQLKRSVNVDAHAVVRRPGVRADDARAALRIAGSILLRGSPWLTARDAKPGMAGELRDFCPVILL